MTDFMGEDDPLHDSKPKPERDSPPVDIKVENGLVHVDFDMGIENVLNLLAGLSFFIFLSSILVVIFDDAPMMFAIVTFILFLVLLFGRSQVDQSYVFDVDAGVVVFRQRFFQFPRHREIALIKEAVFVAISPKYIAQSGKPSYWIYEMVMVMRNGDKLRLSETVSHNADQLLILLESLSKAIGVPVRPFSLTQEWYLNTTEVQYDSPVTEVGTTEVWRNEGWRAAKMFAIFLVFVFFAMFFSLSLV